MLPSGSADQTKANATDGSNTYRIGNVFRTLTKGLKTSYATANSSESINSKSSTSILSSQLGDGRTSKVWGVDFEVLFAQLKNGSSNEDRLVAANAFADAIKRSAVSKSVVEIWYAAQDMLTPNNPVDVRKAAFNLLNACIAYDGDEDATSVNKLVYYRTLVEYPVSNDFDLQLRSLKALTKNGRELPVLGPTESPLALILSTWLNVIFKQVVQDRGAAKAVGQDLNSDDRASLPSEENLHDISAYIINLLKFNYYAFDEKGIVLLLKDVLNICRKTSSKSDIIEGIDMVNTLTVYGNLPLSMLRQSIETICAASSLIPELFTMCWEIILHLMNSHLATNMVGTLYDILREKKAPSRGVLKGAIVFLQKLLEHDPTNQKVYNLNLNSTTRSFNIVMNSANNILIDQAVCKSMMKLLLNNEVYNNIRYEDYKSPDSPLVIIARASKNAILPIKGVEMSSGLDEETDPANSVRHYLEQILLKLKASYLADTFAGPAELLIGFFLEVSPHLDEETADLVVSYYVQEHICFPSTSGWQNHVEEILQAFYRDQSRSLALRTKVIHHMKAVYWIVKEVCEEDVVEQFLDRIFSSIPIESDMNMLAQVIDFGVGVAALLEIDGFKKLVALFHSCMRTHNQAISNSTTQKRQSIMDLNSTEFNLTTSIPALHSSQSSASSSQSKVAPLTSELGPTIEDVPIVFTASHIIAKAFVIMFLHGLERNGAKCAVIYKTLLKITNVPSEWDPETVVIIYRLLFRIRVNKASRVVLLTITDMDGLADTLGRHYPRMAPEARKDALWIHPEPDEILGAPIPPRASYYVTVCGNDNKVQLESRYAQEGDEITEEYYITRKQGIAGLNISCWLSSIVQQLKDGASWEVYSFILGHLAPQLANLQLYMYSKTEIQWLRSVFCEQISTKIPSVELPRGISRADIQAVLVRTMSSLLSYHMFFSKIDQDNIVKALLVGLMSSEKVAAPSVHSLLVCSYEFPISIKKFLSQIFTSFQTKITNPGLSVHILEFLTAMARIPSVTSNFTQDDFKRVFAMSFKYMEHANDLSSSSSTPTSPAAAASSNLSRVLSQYLIALAYSVVSTWFLAMRMSDRKDLAPFIIRGLLLANGNRASLQTAGNVPSAGPEKPGPMTPSDERSWASIDLISRFTYSDVELKMHTVFSGLSRNRPKSEVVGNIWIHGISIVSIETFVKTGMSQVVVRRPSGTSSFNIFPDNRMVPSLTDPKLLLSGGASLRSSNTEARSPSPPADSISADDQLSFLPGYFFTELVTPPEFQSTLSPTLIQNPSEWATVRAISMFDRTPVVEFHKIGIIYIGLNQSSENDILANSVGSKPYLDFLDDMGKLIRLRGNTQVYTGGLDTENDTDGEYAYAYSDKITQAIFHCTTIMPSRRSGSGSGSESESEDAPFDGESLSNKKRHIGNNYVNIYWNDSGKQFQFDTIRSQFNFINIVISPHTRHATTFDPDSTSSSIASALIGGSEDSSLQFFKVRVFVKPSVDASTIFSSPASHLKVIGKSSLSLFVRNIAFNADIFAVVWHARPDDEYLSNWQYRLRQIRNLRDRTVAAAEKAAQSTVETEQRQKD
ncbi:hypothetical protein V1512DRAFT_261271 [Lipomyces arxii]|uniref:uncharacterized protein n=1 Tax=Lipomyces arxii TaxID=56418 RepID=UPI0034CDBF20